MDGISQDTLNDMKLRPRLCHLTKWEDFNGYGFNLHAEKGKAGQFIGKVDEGSPAEAAFLQHGDRIIEVNGVNIGNENHKQVVERIKAGGNETRLLVVDGETDIHFKNEKIRIRGEMSEVVYCKTPVTRGVAVPVLNYNQTPDIQQNEETGETTSEGVLESTPADASSVDGAILITNGIDSDLPAPPPELVENGIASKVEAEAIIANVEEDPIYDTADQVTKIEEKADNISHKSNSELETIVSFDKVDLDDEKIETHSEKADSIKDEPVQEIIKAEPEPEPVEIAPAKSVSSILKTNDIEVPHELPKNNGKVKDTDISNPLNLVNLSVEEMRQKLSTKKRVNKFKDMNLKEKHEILEKL